MGGGKELTRLDVLILGPPNPLGTPIQFRRWTGVDGATFSKKEERGEKKEVEILKENGLHFARTLTPTAQSPNRASCWHQIERQNGVGAPWPMYTDPTTSSVSRARSTKHSCDR